MTRSSCTTTNNDTNDDENEDYYDVKPFGMLFFFDSPAEKRKYLSRQESR